MTDDAVNDDAVSLGALIRAKREELKLSLREVENSTSIRSIYLKGIEEGKVYELIAGVYGMGFIRQYVQFLGLNLEKLSQEYASAFRIPKEKQTFSYGVGTLEPRGSSVEGGKWLSKLLWTLVSGGILVAAYFVAKHFGVI